MDSILSIRNISKNYGQIQALNNVSFDVPKGAVFGILGPNGSGKTTLLGIIMSILNASSGDFLLFNQKPCAAHRKQMGTLLETPNFYHYLSGKRNLEIAAAIKGANIQNIDGVLEKVNLHQRKHSKFQTYSLGMKQRLAIASCLLGDPEVLVFDEPTNGLDPEGIAEIRNLIKKLSQEGKTILMASHLLDEVEKVCTHVAILKKGNLITSGHVDEVLVTDDIVEVQSNNMEALLAMASQLPGHKKITVVDKYVHLHFANGTADLEFINAYFFQNNIILNHLALKKTSLETKFIELTKQ